MLTDKDFLEAADLLNVPVAVIKAIDEVESKGNGFLPTGEVKILYEPFTFGRLTNHKFNGKATVINNSIYPLSLKGKYNKDLCNYGDVSIQHAKRRAAAAFDPVAANKSCSWGRFQLMGFNYNACGYENVFDFLNAMADNERKQLFAFCRFIKSCDLDIPLRKRSWEKFAEGYNGPSYKQNEYDVKIAKAFAKYSGGGK